MMTYDHVFIPVSPHIQTLCKGQDPLLFGNKIAFTANGFDWQWLKDFSVALIGIRKTGSPNTYISLRKAFCNLYSQPKSISIIDLGDIEVINEEEYHNKVKVLVGYLAQHKVLPIVFSEEVDYAYTFSKLYASEIQLFDYALVMPHANRGNLDIKVDANNLIGTLINDLGKKQYELSILGYQTYKTSATDLNFYQTAFIEVARLGYLRSLKNRVEPLLRMAGHFFVDLNALRVSDAPATLDPNPNGIYAEELCQWAFEVGSSDKLDGVTLTNFKLSADHHDQTAKLIAETIWFICDGITNRLGEYPIPLEKMAVKHTVDMGMSLEPVLFYQSRISKRLWFELNIEGKPQYVPCLYEDYLQVAQNQVPERWLWYLKKYNKRRN